MEPPIIEAKTSAIKILTADEPNFLARVFEVLISHLPFLK
jgi:hypothetical protein